MEGKVGKRIPIADIFSPEQMARLTGSKTHQPEQETAPSPNVPATVEQTLIIAQNEQTVRENLLNAVTVDERGVAHCVNPLTRVNTALVAVRVDDAQNASVVPLVQTEDGSLKLILPDDRPSRIGFFVGSSQARSSAVLRNGEYPGEPLTTETLTDDSVREVPYGLTGLRNDSEQAEIRWAGQIGLEDLGFDLTRTRGVFNRGHKPFQSDFWQDSPLVVVPSEMEDLVRHHDSNIVKVDEYQLLVYGPSEPRPPQLNYRGVTRGMIGGWSTKPESRYNPLQSGSTGYLEGAFKIVVTPQPGKVA